MNTGLKETYEPSIDRTGPLIAVVGIETRVEWEIDRLCSDITASTKNL